MHVTPDVVLFVYRVMLNISTKNRIIKFYQRSYIVISSDLCNAIKKILDKISCHRHFKKWCIFSWCTTIRKEHKL